MHYPALPETVCTVSCVWALVLLFRFAEALALGSVPQIAFCLRSPLPASKAWQMLIP